jgi:enoyl-CoA hydratase/carnithine racemase
MANVEFDRRDGVAVVTLSRPDRLRRPLRFLDR